MTASPPNVTENAPPSSVISFVSVICNKQKFKQNEFISEESFEFKWAIQNQFSPINRVMVAFYVPFDFRIKSP